MTEGSLPYPRAERLLDRFQQVGVGGLLRRLVARAGSLAAPRRPRRPPASQGRPPPHLGLKPGDWVEVRPEAEIRATLDGKGKLGGLLLMPGMTRYCGRRFRVRKRVDRILIETTGELRRVRNTVLLDDACCDGFGGSCDRLCYYFWREAWLRRAPRAGERRGGPGGSLTVRAVSPGPDLEALLPAWRTLAARRPDPDLAHDPDYVLAHYREMRDALALLVCEREGALAGVAPFLRDRGTIRCRLGDVTLLRLPRESIRFLSGSACLPDDEDVWDLVFSHALAIWPDFHSLRMDLAPDPSFFATWTRSSLLLSGALRARRSEPVEPRLLVRRRGSFEEYIRGRPRLRRIRDGLRPLLRHGEIRLRRYSAPEEVDDFLAAAVPVSRRSWQHRVLGLGIRDEARERENYRELALRGWFRSYVLYCGARPVAYLVGQQGHGRFLAVSTGYDPDLRAGAPGLTLFLRAIEDLFGHDRPAWIDLGRRADYKARLATDTVADVGFRFLRRGEYAVLSDLVERGIDAASAIAARLLDRAGMKERMHRVLRDAPVEPAEIEPEGAAPGARSDAPPDRWVSRWVEIRNAARAKKDYALADLIRAELEREGVVLRDTPERTLWERVGAGAAQ